MNKSWFKENGFLSNEGEAAFADFKKALKNVIAQAEAQDMNWNEFQILQANLAKMVGDHVSDFLQSKREIAKKFDDMTDEQFENYLKGKYGEHWMLVSLTNEELARVRPLSRETIEKAMVEGRAAYEAAVKATPMVRIDPSLRFK